MSAYLSLHSYFVGFTYLILLRGLLLGPSQLIFGWLYSCRHLVLCVRVFAASPMLESNVGNPEPEYCGHGFLKCHATDES